MHSPETLAFSVKWPFNPQKMGKSKYYKTIIDIWHHDPCKDGSDDSCGWSFVKLTEEERAWAKKLGHEEYQFMLGKHGYDMTTFELVFNIWSTIAWRRFKRRDLSSAELTYIHHLAANPFDNFRYWTKSVKEKGADELAQLFCRMFALYLTHHRPWWKHPQWHVHHWHLNFVQIAQLKRALFSRCATCGKRFRFGYCPTSTSWHGTGPQWFKSEQNVHHGECLGHAAAVKGEPNEQ